ncbi:MAG TPA: hypothetical protein EYG57_18860 [Planctomycetes bacterium]|nr:hypothetical protein [Planctomycetaceae bacterium]HIM31596.1 hypothetical protein [Planctomycetota bacterium]
MSSPHFLLSAVGKSLLFVSVFISSAAAEVPQQDREATAIGFAVSLDGVKWHKHPQNPVLRPDPKPPWESHYVSSQSVVRLPDGSFRMWYASRKKPPFKNLYFALNTAHWTGPSPKTVKNSP